MPFDDHTPNFAYSLVATAPSPATTGLSLVVTAAQGSRFPTPPFNATVWPVSTQPTPANAEIVRVTAISTDTLTIVRAQESTTARTVIVGDQIAATVTAQTLTDVEALGSPDLALSQMLSPRDNLIPASTSAYVVSDYELGGSYGVYPTTAAGATPGFAIASPVTLTGRVVITALYVYADISAAHTFGASGNIRGGLYSDTAGVPDARLHQTSPVAFATGDSVVRIPVTAGPEVSGTVWLAFQLDTSPPNLGGSNVAPGYAFRSVGVSYAGGLPSPFGALDGSGSTLTYPIFAQVESVTEIGAGALLEIA